MWHIMQMYMAHGMNDFVMLLGYRGDLIANWFINHAPYAGSNLRVSGGGDHEPTVEVLDQNCRTPWNVTLCPTGVDTEKGERLRKAAKFLSTEPNFMATYGDGLSDIDLKNLAAFHESHGKLATVTAVRVNSQWGHLGLDNTGAVRELIEKPPMDAWVNGGFFVLRKEALEFLEPGDTFESNCLPRLAAAGELMAYRHEGFWTAMDTYKDNLLLNELWESGKAPWGHE